MYLLQESLNMPAKLDAMEQALIQQKLELRELKHMSKDALNARDQTKVSHGGSPQWPSLVPECPGPNQGELCEGSPVFISRLS